MSTQININKGTQIKCPQNSTILPHTVIGDDKCNREISLNKFIQLCAKKQECYVSSVDLECNTVKLNYFCVDNNNVITDTSIENPQRPISTLSGNLDINSSIESNMQKSNTAENKIDKNNTLDVTKNIAQEKTLKSNTEETEVKNTGTNLSSVKSSVQEHITNESFSQRFKIYILLLVIFIVILIIIFAVRMLLSDNDIHINNKLDSSVISQALNSATDMQTTEL